MGFSEIEFVAATAVLCSFCSGLMGVGGGVIMAPLLLYAPSLVPGLEFPVKMIAGLTVTQDLVGSLAGALTHRRYKLQNRELLGSMGSAIGAGALVGAVASGYVRSELILIVLAILVTIGAGSMVFLSLDTGQAKTAEAAFPRNRAIVVAALIGLLAGFIGQGSAFILIPAMLLVLRIPLRVTVSNALGIVFCAALGGLLGRWGTQQISPFWLLLLLAAAIPGTLAGSYVSHRIRPNTLRIILTALLIAVSFEIWMKTLGH